MNSDGGEKSAMLTVRQCTVICSECGGHHSVANCWNLYPKKTPPGMKKLSKAASVVFVEPNKKSSEDTSTHKFAWVATLPGVSTRYMWWVDCGATNYISPYMELFVKYQPYVQPVDVKIKDGHMVQSLGRMYLCCQAWWSQGGAVGC